jgi:hypothetical protein
MLLTRQMPYEPLPASVLFALEWPLVWCAPVIKTRFMWLVYLHGESVCH